MEKSDARHPSENKLKCGSEINGRVIPEAQMVDQLDWREREKDSRQKRKKRVRVVWRQRR